MRKPIALVTGANGEIGHGLVTRLAAEAVPVVTLDVDPLDSALARLVHREITGSILDDAILERLLAQYEVDRLFHLAALLSARSEYSPVTAHRVNVEGTLKLLEFAHRQGESQGREVMFVFPSSMAVYGLPDRDTRARAGPLSEDQWNVPVTMYGCNKLYCEQLGRYYARGYKQLSPSGPSGHVDFRAIRFPGVISAVTEPSGGSSDYAPGMTHAAARGQSYACFVRPDTRIPFMAMPDAIETLLQLSDAPRESLTRTGYNVAAFNPSADEIRQAVLEAFPGAEITYRVDERRQAIVDSWPRALDDTAARRDWGFAPRYGFESAFSEYLIPTVKERYAG